MNLLALFIFPIFQVIVLLVNVRPSAGAYNPSRSIFAPKLSVLSHEATTDLLDIRSGEELHLKCTGRRPLVWIFPNNNNENSFVEENEVRLTSRCDHSMSDGLAEQCTSEVIISAARFSMTGYYVCHYNNTKIDEYEPLSASSSSGDLAHPETSGSLDQIYIFVNDPNNLIVPYEGIVSFLFIALFQSQPATIPCRPTYSTAEVSLWKTDTKAGVHQEIRANTTLGITYDARKGFHFSHPRWDHDTNELECRFQVNEITAKSVINIHWSVSPNDLNPMIDDFNARQVFVNDTFTLKCLVHIDIGVIVVIEWDYPNKNLTTKRIHKSAAQTGRTVVSGNTYETVSVNLTVANATQADAGIYRCNVHAGNTRMFTATKRVAVYDGQMPTSIKFQSANNSSSSGSNRVEVEVGQNVELTVLAKAFPDINLIELSWYKDGELINISNSGGGSGGGNNNGRHYQMEIYSEQVDQINFRINQAIPSDSGLYTLVGNSSTVTANISFAVLIVGDPEIIVTGSHDFYVEHNIYRLVCKSYSYPVANIWWQWLQCDSLDKCLHHGKVKQWTNVTQVVGRDDDNRLAMEYEFVETQPYLNQSIMTVQANRSGIYRCLSKNFYGLESQQVQFAVMDGKHMFYLEASTEEPTINETIMVKCKASVFDYEQVWMEIRYAHGKDSANRPKMFNATGRLSLMTMMTIEAVQYSDSGTILCHARKRKSETIEARLLQLNIKDVTPPALLDSNLANNVIEKVANEEIELKCLVTGFPTPKIVWHRDNEVFSVHGDAGVRLEDRGQRLVFMRLLEKDSGHYVCTASNRGGTIVRETYLKVVGSNVDSSLQTSEVIGTFFLSLIGALLLMLALFIGKRIREARQHKQELEFFSRGIFENGQLELFNPDVPLDEQIDLLPYDARYEFPKENLELGATLGQGAFGRVVKAAAFDLDGEHTMTTVAVKMLKEHADFNQRKALIAELKILIHLGRHLNIVNLLGAVTKNLARGELLVIVEYCEHGNLRSYLMQQRNNFVNQIDPLSGELRAEEPEPAAGNGNVRYSISSYQNCHSLTVRHEPNFASGRVSAPGGGGGGERNNYVNTMDDRSNVQILNANGAMELPQVAFYNHNYIGSIDCSNSGQSIGGFRIGNNNNNNNTSVSTSDLIGYTFQCARGMEYLTSRKLIHRDLAARNVLLTSDGIVKICDFGLAKDVYKYDNYVKKEDGPLPIKWMAIESIGYKVFTSKSDVWSFGILMWEIFTLGGTPYPGITIDEEFYKRLQNGYRLQKPELCSNKLYDVMHACWHKDPETRPTFSELCEMVGAMLSEKTKQYYIDMNERYMRLNEQQFDKNEEETLEEAASSFASAAAMAAASAAAASTNEDYLKMSSMSSGENGSTTLLH